MKPIRSHRAAGQAPLRVLIIPDKFKGTLTAGAAAEAMAAGWRKGRPQDSLTCLPMSDGGDGFGEVFSLLLQGCRQTVRTVDAAHRPCATRWWWEPKTRTAIVESAAVIGLALLPPQEFHPFALDTFGLGAVFRAAATKGARRCVVGIGGSATNDGGFGLARALGWEFLARDGEALKRWTDLVRLDRVRVPARPCQFHELLAAVDVRNPLLGPRGATRVYGPQKGLRPMDFDLAERCLGNLARVLGRQADRAFAREPGAGAAGGLGFGMLAFLRGRLEPGFELFARQAALGAQLRRADLVITGEGAIDRSTRMGKGVGQIARCCSRLRLPCIALAGQLGLSSRSRLFTRAHALTELTTPADALTHAALWLARLSERTAFEAVAWLPPGPAFRKNAPARSPGKPQGR